MARIVLLLALVVTLAPARVHAKVIKVHEGPGTPLQDAINGAASGDTLRLIGTFPEAIVIDRRLEIIGDNGFFAIDAGCTAPVAVTIAADGVTLQRLTVRGGSVANVRVQGRDRVTLNNVLLRSSCAGVQYGLDAVATTRLTVKNTLFGAFSPSGHGMGCPPSLQIPEVTVFGAAALRVADTAAAARVKLPTNSICAGAPIGILLENTADLPGVPPAVTVQRNPLAANFRGIVLRASDGTAIRANTVRGANGTAGQDALAGIELDADSDDNFSRRTRSPGTWPT